MTTVRRLGNLNLMKRQLKIKVVLMLVIIIVIIEMMAMSLMMKMPLVQVAPSLLPQRFLQLLGSLEVAIIAVLAVAVVVAVALVKPQVRLPNLRVSRGLSRNSKLQ
jgi:membrane protein implicated in regulation of membrane protease activity